MVEVLELEREVVIPRRKRCVNKGSDSLSISTYSMSYFKFHGILCNELEQMIANFYRGQKK